MKAMIMIAVYNDKWSGWEKNQFEEKEWGQLRIREVTQKCQGDDHGYKIVGKIEEVKAFKKFLTRYKLSDHGIRIARIALKKFQEKEKPKSYKNEDGDKAYAWTPQQALLVINNMGHEFEKGTSWPKAKKCGNGWTIAELGKVEEV